MNQIDNVSFNIINEQITAIALTNLLKSVSLTTGFIPWIAKLPHSLTVLTVYLYKPLKRLRMEDGYIRHQWLKPLVNDI